MQTVLERQDLPCMYLAPLKLENIAVITNAVMIDCGQGQTEMVAVKVPDCAKSERP